LPSSATFQPLTKPGPPKSTPQLPENPILILGFGQQGQVLASMLSSPLAAPAGGPPLSYIAVDPDPGTVAAARAAGLRVVRGDCAVAPAALLTARPTAVAVCCNGGDGGGGDSSSGSSAAAVAAAAAAFPGARIYACASGFVEAAALRAAGAHRVAITGSEAGGGAAGSGPPTRAKAALVSVLWPTSPRYCTPTPPLPP
jgi:hypothetical protein